MDLRSVNKHTPRNLAISRVFFSCFGGMKMDGAFSSWQRPDFNTCG
jgi:hypothetical protein